MTKNINEITKNTEVIDYGRELVSNLDNIRKEELSYIQRELEIWCIRNKSTILNPSVQYIESKILPKIKDKITL